MLKEYAYCQDTFGNTDVETWTKMVTIDLRHVTSARAYDMRDHDPRYTILFVQPGSVPFIINEEYGRFLRDWHSVKRTP